MTWKEGLLSEQEEAASHTGSSAYLIAGPGTGKTLTLTRRVCYLLEAEKVSPELVCVLTFTRAAVRELRQRIETELGAGRVPRIMTLHSFSLRQLLRNSDKLLFLPQPLRIADDWEERNIILEDLKALLRLGRIDEAKGLLNRLSADWQTLAAENNEKGRRFPNPAFIGAWSEHRNIYGYVLRAELVYQLKRALEQYDDIKIEGPPAHLLVDEYQDLNLCDLSVVKSIKNMGVELYVAGDDDQSIYGFRMAYPEGIRQFPEVYRDARKLELEICKRCDQEILELGLFVARQDYNRIEKALRADDDRVGAEIALLRFDEQDPEALGVAKICCHLINNRGVAPEEVLILLRSDRNGVFSSVLRQRLQLHNVPVSVNSGTQDPFDKLAGRTTIAFLRLFVNENDHLSWRALLKNRRNRIGACAIDSIYQLARQQDFTFSEALFAISLDPSLVSNRFGQLIKAEVRVIKGILQELRLRYPSESIETTDLISFVGFLLDHLVENTDESRSIYHRLNLLIDELKPSSVEDLLNKIDVMERDIEQDIAKDKVNILTMHKAKGLTADAVIIVGAEDEYLPGRVEGEMVGDERRLLYVSLTRAKHYLFITYCNKRTRQQRHTGRTSGQQRRNLTRFLQDAPLRSQHGTEYVNGLEVRQL